MNVRNIWSDNQSQCSLNRAMHSSLIWWELMNTHMRRCIPEQLMLKLMQFVFNYARSFRPVACYSIVLIEITSNPRIGQRGWAIVYTDLIDRRYFSINRDLIWEKMKVWLIPAIRSTATVNFKSSPFKIDPTDIATTFFCIYICTLMHKL